MRKVTAFAALAMMGVWVTSAWGGGDSPRAGAKSPISFHVATAKPSEGFQKLTVALPVLEGEMSAANNSRDVSIQIFERKITVMLLAGVPNPDIGFFRRFFASDPNWEAIIRTVKRDGGFYEG